MTADYELMCRNRERLLTDPSLSVLRVSREHYEWLASRIERDKARISDLEAENDTLNGALTMRANDVHGLGEDIDKLVRVVERAISASVTVQNELARERLLEAIQELPMRLRVSKQTRTAILKEEGR